MLLGKLKSALLGLGAAGTMLLSFAQASRAGEILECLTCPAPYVHCQEGPPRLKFKHHCPRPVCGPCDLKHFGYYPTCWAPYPWPPDYSCCPAPGVLPPGIPPGPLGSVTKLPEADFSQPSLNVPTQTSALVPAAAALVAPSQGVRPSPYHGQTSLTAPDFTPGR